MAQDQPVTKGEFDEGMQMVANAFENVATKEDLKKALQDTKEELIAELKQYATKDDMKGMFESAVERIEDAVLVTQRDHERRITALERR